MNWAIVGTSLSPAAGPLAQATQSGTAKPTPALEFLSSPLSLLVVLMVFFYVFIFTSKRKEDRKKKNLLNTLKRGDRVQTIGGIIGTVVQTEEKKVQLKVDESSNTKIWFSRSAVFQVLGDEKAVEVPAK